MEHMQLYGRHDVTEDWAKLVQVALADPVITLQAQPPEEELTLKGRVTHYPPISHSLSPHKSHAFLIISSLLFIIQVEINPQWSQH